MGVIKDKFYMSFFSFLLWKKFFFWNWTNHIVIENLQKMCNSPFHLLKELIIVFDFLNRAILGTRYLLYNSWHLLACFKTHFRYFRIKNFQLKKNITNFKSISKNPIIFINRKFQRPSFLKGYNNPHNDFF